MSRIFISGSSTGLGLMTAELLVQQGHQVVLHARNANRAEDAQRALPRLKPSLLVTWRQLKVPGKRHYVSTPWDASMPSSTMLPLATMKRIA
jgi:NAD(P)-dependent dehydrogenase (short-subunit alcohol dehydrogenase family)